MRPNIVDSPFLPVKMGLYPSRLRSEKANISIASVVCMVVIGCIWRVGGARLRNRAAQRAEAEINLGWTQLGNWLVGGESWLREPAHPGADR